MLIGALAAPAVASPASNPVSVCATSYRASGYIADFDDDGIADLAVGAPGADSGTGAVDVHDSAGDKLVLQPGRSGLPRAPAPGSHFGAAIVAANLDDDQCSDLLVGEPGLTVDGQRGAGGVQILYGKPGGFVAGPLLTRGSNGVPGVPGTGEHFGASLAVELDRDSGEGAGTTVTDLHIGAPGATVSAGSGQVAAAGMVVELDYDMTDGQRLGNPASTAEYWQGHGVPAGNAHPIAGRPTAGAHFGAVMSGRLVGAPEETVHSRVDAGFAAPLNFSNDENSVEDGYTGLSSFGVFGHQAGEHLGASMAEVCGRMSTQSALGAALIGAPGLRVHGHLGAGGVVVVGHLHAKKPVVAATVTQATPGIAGRVASHRRFGTAVTSSSTTGTSSCLFGGGGSSDYLIGTVAVGVPGTSVDGRADAGAVSVFQLRGVKPGTVVSGRLVTRASKGVPGRPTTNARFGAVLGARGLAAPWSASQILVGAPGESAGTGHRVGGGDSLEFAARTLRLQQAVALRPITTATGVTYGAAVPEVPVIGPT
jgi:hypothetical protein